MKKKILCGSIVILSIILIGVVSSKKETNFSFDENTETKEKIEEPSHTIKVLNPKVNQIIDMNLEEYIIGVVAAEMPASFEIEALKAQAVAARTYAIYKQIHKTEDYDVIMGISDQAFNTLEEMAFKWQDKYSEYLEKINQAVTNTKGEILTYKGQVIESFYFAMSNGYTENCEMVFLEKLPYITSVESSWDNSSLNNYEVTKKIDKQDFCSLLNISCEQITIDNIQRTETNRVNTISINGTEFKGTNFRKLLSLRSTDFDILINESEVEITTRGSGHGVGMSQYGANGMAKEGATYQQILKYFYQEIEFSKI